MDPIIIDVREKDEFDAQHIPGSIWVPLSQFSELAPGVLQALAGKRLLIMCRSGKRAALAKSQIAQLGLGGQLETEIYAGGILQWAKQGKPVTTGRKGHVPIMRQVQIVVGLCVLSAVLLSFVADVRFAWLAAFFGAALALAGFTGFCPLARLLARMPWNRTAPGVPQDQCAAGPKSQRH
jgi:rhodanese-related sulfurtransferase